MFVMRAVSVLFGQRFAIIPYLNLSRKRVFYLQGCSVPNWRFFEFSSRLFGLKLLFKGLLFEH